MKLSIIIPNYNKEKYLKQLLDSLYDNINNTKFKNQIEIIFIDDCSTDNSKKIVLTHKLVNFKNFNYHIFSENCWVAAARNKGIEEAKGDYITFIDSDDYVLPNYIETLISYIDDGECDFYGFDYIDEPVHKCDVKIERVTCAYIWTGLYNREYLNKHKIRFDDNFKYRGYGEDLDFYEKFLATHPKCKYTNDKIYVYHLGVDYSLSSNKKEVK